SGADQFDASGFQIYLDVDGSGTFNAGDTILPNSARVYYLVEIPEGRTTKVLVVADIPLSATDAQVAGVSLEATAYGSVDGTTGQYVATADTLAPAACPNTPGAEAPTVVDNVFADAEGVLDPALPAGRNGKHSAADGYIITSASIVVGKTSTVIDDPINGTTNPKAIPGATIRYCITVTNNGGANATNVTITDAMPNDGSGGYYVTYQPGTLYAGGATCAQD